MNTKILIVIIAAVIIVAVAAVALLYHPGNPDDKLKMDLEAGDYYDYHGDFDNYNELYLSVEYFYGQLFVDLDSIVGGMKDKIEFKGETVDCIKFTNEFGNTYYVNEKSGFIYKMIENYLGETYITQYIDTSLDIDSVPELVPPAIGTFVTGANVEPTEEFIGYSEVLAVDDGTIYIKTDIEYVTDKFHIEVQEIDDEVVIYTANDGTFIGDEDRFLEYLHLGSFLEVNEDAVMTDKKTETIETAYGLRDTTVYTYELEYKDSTYDGKWVYNLWVGKNGVIYVVDLNYFIQFSDLADKGCIESETGKELYKLTKTNLFV